jgi:hypothetical protein
MASIILPFHCMRPFVSGTLSAILADVATHFALNREELAERLFH